MMQFATPEAAAKAIEAFDGRSLSSDGQNTMRVEYSRNDQLIVHVNNERCWDFTVGGITAMGALALQNSQMPTHIGYNDAAVQLQQTLNALGPPSNAVASS